MSKLRQWSRLFFSRAPDNAAPFRLIPLTQSSDIEITNTVIIRCVGDLS